MAKDKSPTLQIATFADHKVITQPNPLRKVLRRVLDKDLDDPIGRAENALAGLSGEFQGGMAAEAGPPGAAHRPVLRDGLPGPPPPTPFRPPDNLHTTAPI